MAKPLTSIYQQFYQYSKDDINNVIKNLKPEERELIRLRYGDDLNNPISGELNQRDIYKFYNLLIPKMNRILGNLELNREKNMIKNTIGNFDYNVYMDVISRILYLENSDFNDAKLIIYNRITQSDYNKFLDFIKSDVFGILLKKHSPKEITVLFFKFGYIHNRYFSNNAIANFLGIDSKEVLSILNNLLLQYKESIIKSFDNTIKNQNNSTDNVKKSYK